MVSEAIAHSGCLASVQLDRALTIEVRGHFVAVQIFESRSERLATVKLLRRDRRLRIHIDHEMRIRRKERHLACRVTAISTICISVDQLADRNQELSEGSYDFPPSIVWAPESAEFWRCERLPWFLPGDCGHLFRCSC
jgi:hypothetical protein